MNKYLSDLDDDLDEDGDGLLDDSDEFGARRLLAVRKRSAAVKAAAKGLAKGLSRAEKYELLRGEDVIYGFDTGAAGVNAGVTATVTVTPQRRHVPKRLTMTATVAGNFVITDIRVGVEPVLITTGAISCAIFIQDSTAPSFRSIISEVGTDVSITVTNITGANARFTATMVGTYVPAGL